MVLVKTKRHSNSSRPNLTSPSSMLSFLILTLTRFGSNGEFNRHGILVTVCKYCKCFCRDASQGTISDTMGVVRRLGLSTVGASGAKAFAIAGTHYLAVTNRYSGSVSTVNSIIYRFSHASGSTAAGYQIFQSIPTKGAIDVEFFTVDGLHLLAIANHGGGNTFFFFFFDNAF